MEHLPLWFLILALFLPRISLLAAYFLHDLVSYGLHGWVPPTLGAVFPRFLVLILIFQDRGWSAWLLVHGLAAAIAYLAAGKSRSRQAKG